MFHCAKPPWFSVRLSPDAYSECHRVEVSDDADGSTSHNESVEEVSKLTAGVSSVAAASVPPATSAWLTVGHQEHADVPWFVDFHNAGSTAFTFVQVLLAINSFIAATVCFFGFVHF